MRRNLTGRALAAIFGLGLLVLAVPTSATAGSSVDDASIAAVNCNQYSGGGVYPRSASYVRVAGNGAAIGAVQLCKNGSSYWGYVVFYAPLPSGSWGQAYLYQYRSGVLIRSASCDTAPQGSPSGGNGWVRPGQTQCWTHKFDGSNAGDTFKACGTDYFGQYPDRSIIDAWGCTAQVR